MALAPTAAATQFACGSSPTIPTSRWTVLPSGFGTPNSLLSWPTTTKKARPTTKPSMTGLDRNWVTNPRRARPATRKTPPVISTNADAYAWYVCGSDALAAGTATSDTATDDARSAAVAEVGPTLT